MGLKSCALQMPSPLFCTRHRYIYTGNSDGIRLSAKEKTLSKPTQSVIGLCKQIENCNRNVTTDNWFSSMELLDVLEEKKLTYVGTLQKDKKEIPEEFLPEKTEPLTLPDLVSTGQDC